MKVRTIVIEHPDRPDYERRDCTVHALANCTGMPYSRAHGILESTSDRKVSRGCKAKINKIGVELAGEWLISKVEIKFARSPHRSFRGVTVTQFCRDNPQGRFYCRISGHAFSIVDGTRLENRSRNSNRSRIYEAWLFTPIAAVQKAS